MELKETIEGMTSDDYKERFVAEVQQNRIRREKLCNLLSREAEGKLDFELSCPVRILEEQADLMGKLDLIYMERAACEGIKLD